MSKENRVILWFEKVFQNTLSKWILTDFPSLIRENFENGFLLCRPAVGFACSTQFIDVKIHSSWVNFHFFSFSRSILCSNRFPEKLRLSIRTFLHFLSFILRDSGLNYPVKAFDSKIRHIEKCNLFLRNVHYSALSFYTHIT